MEDHIETNLSIEDWVQQKHTEGYLIFVRVLQPQEGDIQVVDDVTKKPMFLRELDLATCLNLLQLSPEMRPQINLVSPESKIAEIYRKKNDEDSTSVGE